jgi:PIN domain nuclease of toxin-antitoxin system
MGREPVIVLDTHVLIWWLTDASKLSPPAKKAIAAAARDNALAISSISLFEIATLVRRERLRLAIDLSRWLGALLSLPQLNIEPISTEIAWTAGAYAVGVPGDPADRIIVATAQALGASLVTADDGLRAGAPIDTIW